MPTRRALLLGATGAAFSRSFGLAQDKNWRDKLRAALAAKQPETLGAELLPADDPLWDKAHGILDTAAANGVPYKMANYLTSIPDEFRKEWSDRITANPVIVLLWTATDLKKPPDGDETAWCAAFMNWCLTNAKPAIKGTGSPRSQSFLKWGTEVWSKASGTPPTDAKPGDVVVFTLKSNPAQGHVAFFHRLPEGLPNYIDTLGGNQSDSFKISRFNMNADLELATIRTVEGLRNV